MSTDKRESLRGLLRRYHPISTADREQANHVCAFVDSTNHCFDRTHLEGHITGSAWIVEKSGKHVLLTHHKKLGKWLQLGGHADGESDILKVAWREAQEESGLTSLEPVSSDIFDLDVHRIPARGNEPEHFHYDVRFLFRADESEPLILSIESKELVWAELHRLTEYSKEESMLRMREKWFAFEAAHSL